MKINIKETQIDKSQEDKKIVGVQMPISMYEELVKKSQEEWLSISDIIRKLIRNYLKEER